MGLTFELRGSKFLIVKETEREKTMTTTKTAKTVKTFTVNKMITEAAKKYAYGLGYDHGAEARRDGIEELAVPAGTASAIATFHPEVYEDKRLWRIFCQAYSAAVKGRPMAPSMGGEKVAKLGTVKIGEILQAAISDFVSDNGMATEQDLALWLHNSQRGKLSKAESKRCHKLYAEEFERISKPVVG